jgi:peptide/nickel transport system permease protein
MPNSLFKKLIFSIFVLLGSIWMICYLISLIPGNTSDFFAEDSNSAISNNQDKKVPVFYFSVLPTQSTENISTPPFFPSFNWNGTQNSFHITILQTVDLIFGNSSIDQLSIRQKIVDALSWTFSIQFLHYLFLLIFSIFIGKFISNNSSVFSKIISSFFLALHSIPSFWLASLLIFILCTQWFIFPSSFINITENSVWFNLLHSPQYFILPIICLVLPSISYVSRIYSEGLKKATHSSFWNRALSTGISSSKLINLEAKPYGLISIFGWFVGIIPALFIGSVIIENLFSIPGMGRLLFHSISIRDWDVVKFILVFISTISIIAYLVSDFLIRLVDPRMRKNEN